MGMTEDWSHEYLPPGGGYGAWKGGFSSGAASEAVEPDPSTGRYFWRIWGFTVFGGMIVGTFIFPLYGTIFGGIVGIPVGLLAALALNLIAARETSVDRRVSRTVARVLGVLGATATHVGAALKQNQPLWLLLVIPMAVFGWKLSGRATKRLGPPTRVLPEGVARPGWLPPAQLSATAGALLIGGAVALSFFTHIPVLSIPFIATGAVASASAIYNGSRDTVIAGVALTAFVGCLIFVLCSKVAYVII